MRRLSSAFILLCCAAMSLFLRAQSETSPQGPPAAVTNASDPRQSESQPDLSVDRDPVLSPDPEDNAPLSAKTQNAGRSEVQKTHDNIYTLHADVDEVLLNCTVVDEKGQLVRDLNRDDFRVWEDNVPQTIASFQHQDLPVSVGILVDNSGSMRAKRSAVNTAALDLIKASNSADAAFIVNFSDEAYIDQDLTSNLGDLERGLSHVDSRGSTALYDAVAASAIELANHAKQPKQALLIITDGEDNASRLDLRQTIRRVQNLGGPVVYSIGLLFDDDNREKSLHAKDALEMLSQETGGIAYFPRSLQDVDAIAMEVASDIRNQYTIGYHSTKPANLGGYRVVHVEVKSPRRGKLIVRTRNGYYPKQIQSTPMQTAQKTQ
ncbi:VWA domain-containing protein [Alloacidobacterium dinghuense]|uniref:VWA domain-containing protein n=1 Tax=Alloacidobacterium dinghuense TaxID=2763107 RepID=A0A7G8BKY8_9BACT|nr:VWA domain-containing protein [Alloacidobacterium dinghuense]